MTPEAIVLSSVAWLALAGPAFAAVSALEGRRVLLLPENLEIACVAAAAAFAAVSIAAQIALVAPAAFVVIAPPAIAAAPWATGESIRGPSERQDESFFAALVAGYATAATTHSAGWIPALCIAGASATVYLCTRGGLFELDQ